MYTYRVVKEDFYTGKRSRYSRTVTKKHPLKVGGLYMHLGRGFIGSYRVLEEIKNEPQGCTP